MNLKVLQKQKKPDSIITDFELIVKKDLSFNKRLT